ncbi:DsbA family protein [Bacillus sp. RO3]|nr:DsbA family protein [Bacillus sp. RO3]
MNKMKYLVMITLAIVVALVLVVLLTNQSGDEDETLESHPSTVDQPVLGDQNAPVSVVEFGDFKCPACKSWGETIYPQLKEDFIDTGKAQFSYINTEFHGKESTLSALAAESILKNDPGSYWDFHKELFETQPDQHHDGWITVEVLVEVAGKTTDVDMEQFKQDIEEQTYMDEVKKDSSLVDEFTVELTPTIIINGTKLEDPYDYEKISTLIEEGQN